MNDELKRDVFIKYGIIQINELNMNEKVILSTLCYWSDTQNLNYCFTTYGILSRKFNMNRLQVQRSIKTLIEKEYIIPVRMKKEKSEYILKTKYLVTEKAMDFYRSNKNICIENDTTYIENDISIDSKTIYPSIEIDTQKKEIKKNIKNIFIIPTLEEVTSYCDERNNTVNPQHFIDYYTSNGWMVGRNKMKDWKATVRTWEMNSKIKEKANHVEYPKL